MSAQIPAKIPAQTAAPAPKSASSAATRRPDWLREPLLHFLLIGALLFGVDHLINGRADGGNEILIGADVDEEATQVFKATRGRAPNADELKALRKVWLDNEVLYREGLAMQLDKGDTAIRERVIFKALSVVDSGLKLPAHDDKLLHAWFEQHRAKYDDPARFDFQEAQLAGDSSESAVRAFVDALNSGTPGDAKAGLRVFKGRPHSNLVQSYGEDFARALETASPGRWLALQSREGWRAVRLDAASPAKPGNYEALRGVVLQDWTDQTMAEQRSAAVAALASKYRIKVEAPAK